MVDVANAKTDVVALLTRAPASGGKSRLFAALGRPFDPALLEAMLLDTIDGATLPDASMVLSVTVGRVFSSHVDAPPVQTLPQPQGDLGERMRGTMAQLFDAGARRVVLIGSDLPAITSAPIRAAFDALVADPAALVLGPALDGGYYLIAATQVPPVFEGIGWGTADVLSQTRAAAAAAGLHVQLVEPLGDVDTPEDLQALPASARRTSAWARANGITSSRGSVT
jgi:rSAM/selenodomain-associated transferase 1